MSVAKKKTFKQPVKKTVAKKAPVKKKVAKKRPAKKTAASKKKAAPAKKKLAAKKAPAKKKVAKIKAKAKKKNVIKNYVGRKPKRDMFGFEKDKPYFELETCFDFVAQWPQAPKKCLKQVCVF